METMKDRKYWIRLNTTIEHFYLPIDTWSIEKTAYDWYVVLQPELPAEAKFATTKTGLSGIAR